jgi:hypothetical protein
MRLDVSGAVAAAFGDGGCGQHAGGAGALSLMEQRRLIDRTRRAEAPVAVSLL